MKNNEYVLSYVLHSLFQKKSGIETPQKPMAHSWDYEIDVHDFEEEKKKFDLAKETYEVVSQTPVKPTEKQEIISTLNELVFNNEGFRIFYEEDERSPQELILKDLYIVRQQYIEKLTKNPPGNTKLIAKLKEQQENLLSLAEQNVKKEEMDKIIKDYKRISFSRNSACILQ